MGEKSIAKGRQPKVPITQIVDNSRADINISHYLAVYLWLGWFNVYLVLMTILPIAWFVPVVWHYVRIPFSVVVGILILSAVYPINMKNRPKWGLQLVSWMLSKLPAYFKACVYCEDYEAVQAAAPGIITIEPHDILPVSIFCFSSFVGFFPTHDMRGCLTSGCFAVPGMRHIFAWSGARSVDKSVIRNCLDKGLTPTVCPGGAMEVTFMSSAHDPHTCTLYLRKRMGIIKLAAEYGVPLIPSFTFNQRRAYSYIIPSNSFVHWIGRKVGFIPLMFFGLFNIPLFIPKPRQLNVVVAAPIPVPKMEAPFTEEKLKEYQDQYIDAHYRIFENNKERFGMGHVKLQIL